jgi:hypothetical protein
MLDAPEAAELGLEIITDLTDIERDKVNPLEVVAAVKDHVNGELYVDNFNFALVRQLGRESGQLLTVDRNSDSIERTEDGTNLVTRLYPYGQNNMEITTVTGQAFIDSPKINEYPIIHEGHIDFSDYDNPTALLLRAQQEFAETNHARIDRPRMTYRISQADLWKLRRDETQVNLGDFVTIFDEALGMEVRVRCVALELYPYEPQRSVITLGDPPRSVVEILNDTDAVFRPFFNMALPPFQLPPMLYELMGIDIYKLKELLELDPSQIPEDRIILIDRMPTQKDISGWDYGAVVLVYDPDNPFYGEDAE